MTSAKCALLDDRAVLRLSGADVESFLQGLVSNDVRGLGAGEARFAGLLSPQGKIMFEFFVVGAPDGDGFLLEAGRETLDELIKRLTFYRLRAKVDIADLAASHAVGAVWREDGAQHGAGEGAQNGSQGSQDGAAIGEKAPEITQESAEDNGAAGTGADLPGAMRDELAERGAIVYHDPRLSGLGWRFIAARDGLDDCKALKPAVTSEAYHAHRLALFVPEGGKDYPLGDTFPHEACYDQLSGVSLNKGCYVGQEVVSRMAHRGTARKRCIGFEAAKAPLPEAGAEIVAGGVPIGRLGSSHGRRAMGLVRLDRLAKALAAGDRPSAGGIALDPQKPLWADFEVPAPSAEAAQEP